LLRAILAAVVGDLEAVSPAARRGARLGLVTVDAVARALMVVYARQLTAYGAEVRHGGTGGSPRGQREGGAKEQSATRRSSRPQRRRAAEGIDQAVSTG